MIGGFLGLGLVAKLTLLGFVPAVVFALALMLRRAWATERTRAVRGAAWAAALGAVPILTYVVLNRLVWKRGAITGGIGGVPAAPGAVSKFNFREELSHIWQLFLPPLGMRHQFVHLPLWETWFKGFVGRFGWLDYTFPWWFYELALVVFVIVAALGAGRARAPARHPRAAYRRAGGVRAGAGGGVRRGRRAVLPGDDPDGRRGAVRAGPLHAAHALLVRGNRRFGGSFRWAPLGAGDRGVAGGAGTGPRPPGTGDHDLALLRMSGVTVAIPVRNGGGLLERTLRALARQTVEHELLVCDSGSTDGSSALARASGARVIEIAPGEFNHGRTRNLLVREAGGERVALLTQDAEPADERWLERLLGGFQLAEDVGIVYGPYLPRPGASPAVRSELEGWFRSLSPDGSPELERLQADARGLATIELIGRRGFFTDANACVARSAWERVPFREVPYAEDRVLAIDMLRAGYAKAFVPDAAVLHSHDYTALEQLRRCFDEWRGLREVYGWREPAGPVHLALGLRGALAQARRELIRQGVSPARRRATLAAVSGHHVVRLAGALLGSRADRLPGGARRRLSLEGRASFSPLELDPPDLRSEPDRASPVPS